MGTECFVIGLDGAFHIILKRAKEGKLPNIPKIAEFDVLNLRPPTPPVELLLVHKHRLSVKSYETCHIDGSTRPESQ